jgi:uncharacterized protein with ATP-grasp and redox domains
MRTVLDCVPCFVQQALEAARMATDDALVHEEVVRRVARAIGSMDMVFSPPAMGQKIHRLVRELTGNPDPYREIKERTNRLALELYPEISKRVDEAENPLEMAVRMAVAGNIIDFGVDRRIREEAFSGILDRAAAGELHGDLTAFVGDAEAATSILFLADNAGEIVFDRVLIETLEPQRVTLVVRGMPVLNDAVRVDAVAAGLESVEIVDNGSDAPGTILENCSAEFRERFVAADMVIAKGQGNFETLCDSPRAVWFVLMAKCGVVADFIGCEPGSFVIQKR